MKNKKGSSCIWLVIRPWDFLLQYTVAGKSSQDSETAQACGRQIYQVLLNIYQSPLAWGTSSWRPWEYLWEISAYDCSEDFWNLMNPLLITERRDSELDGPLLWASMIALVLSSGVVTACICRLKIFLETHKKIKLPCAFIYIFSWLKYRRGDWLGKPFPWIRNCVSRK